MEKEPDVFKDMDLWSLKSSCKNVIHILLVAALIYFHVMFYLMIGLGCAAFFAAMLLWKKKDLAENVTTICKGYLYLFLKTVLFSIILCLLF